MEESIDLFGGKSHGKTSRNYIITQLVLKNKFEKQRVMIPTKKNLKTLWTRIKAKTGMDKEQFWKMAKDKSGFNSRCYMNSRYGSLDD